MYGHELLVHMLLLTSIVSVYRSLVFGPCVLVCAVDIRQPQLRICAVF